MTFGVQLAGEPWLPREQVAEAAQLAEELGYETFWVGEGLGRDAFSLLTYLALNTRRIGLGAGVIDLFSRTPFALAQTAAALDELSGGRLWLGLGGIGLIEPGVIENWHGVPYQNPLRRMKEGIEVLRALLRGGPVDYCGRIFRVRGAELRPKPLRAEVPIFVAALGPTNAEMAGEVGDGWLCAYFPPLALGYYRLRIQQGAERAGRDASRVRIAPWVLTCSGEGPRVEAVLRYHLARYIGAPGSLYNVELVQRYGFGRSATAVRLLWGSGQRRAAAAHVEAGLLEALAISGPPEACWERYYHRWGEAAVSPIITVPYGTPPDLIRQTLEAMAGL